MTSVILKFFISFLSCSFCFRKCYMLVLIYERTGSVSCSCSFHVLEDCWMHSSFVPQQGCSGMVTLFPNHFSNICSWLLKERNVEILEHEGEQIETCCLQISKKAQYNINFFFLQFLFQQCLVSKHVSSKLQTREGIHTVK